MGSRESWEVRPIGHSVPPLFPPPQIVLESRKYRLRFAQTDQDLDTVLRLRFRVFNLEMGEGLEASHRTGRDQDPFDAICHHLIVEDTSAGRVIGTYRMQTQEMALASRGFYTAGEFELESLPRQVMEGAIEVGRACIEKPYRNRQVLFLLWRGLAAYMTHHEKRFLFGCCSLTGQDQEEGRRTLRQLSDEGHMHPEIRIRPRQGFKCRTHDESLKEAGRVSIPILFRTYLRYGAKVCGPPAIDREFNTIDFFVILDVEELGPGLRRLFFPSS